MQAIRRIAACAALVSSGAFAEPAEPNAAGGQPAILAHPPAPPELAPLAQDFQAVMANSQLQTYRYNQLTEQALALKKLCETGFGPSDLCPKRNIDAGAGVAGSAPADLPTVAEIESSGRGLTAVLVFTDGRRLIVHQGTALPDGLTVAAITADDVRVRASAGGETDLAFGDHGQVK